MKGFAMALMMLAAMIQSPLALASGQYECLVKASESVAECKGNDATECAKVLKQADCKCGADCNQFIDTIAQCHAEFNQGIHLCTEGDLVCVNGLKSVRTNCIDEAQGTT
ncbi:hypothetical protein [Thalassotalea sp. Y01]|uniref:hypothetical protein n=1 Tax=Thalassotalea sp. Y01 TaxID=2729613 RepID=UPI00145C7DFB|nr:hypothetical protein [Thalassotalea sp. Y01]NMP15105.1 hypothetical protein [Thalassotalea sp. Y01]